MPPSDAPFTEPGRKHPIHLPILESGNRPAIVFLTVNAAKRKPILAKRDSARAILASWSRAQTWIVGRYVIMPDHIHLFCARRDPVVELRRWVKYWKSLVSKIWPRSDEQPIWQVDFWDTQLRRGESYGQKWDYVWRNPVRSGLVDEPEQWPFAGELNVLEWHEA